MERRISERKFVDLNVYISQPGSASIRCVASDISGAGIFLKTNPLYLPRFKQLNLVFALQIKSSNVVRLRQVPAVVTRAESGGVGMRFCNWKNSQLSRRSRNSGF
jgi:hypothetical protein